MKMLKHNSKVIVYHNIDEDGNHCYYFYDGKKKIKLIWGETGYIPNFGDRFPHPQKEIDLRLDNIVWADDDPRDP